MKKSFVILASAFLLIPGLSAAPVKAASFTRAEVERIHHLQDEYGDLSKTVYSTRMLYSKKPHLKKRFKAGRVKNSYVQTQLNFVNYYRSLFGLPPVTMTKTDNNNSQNAAAIMATVSADPFIDQHGIKHNKRPRYITRGSWQLARSTSREANLDFNYGTETPGSVITDYITDRYNLGGSDTGHRAWILSTRLSATGFGTADARNGYRYSVNKIANGDDVFRAASQPVVSYPASGVFPIELLQGRGISWSLYLSDQRLRTKPQITITDMDTGKIYRGCHVRNYSRDGFGNFRTIITYSPGKLPIVDGHQYQVNFNGIYTYTFKLFSQVARDEKLNQKRVTAAPRQTKTMRSEMKEESSLLYSAARLQAQLKLARPVNNALFGRSYQDGSKVINLGSKQWLGPFYRVSNPNLIIGSFKVPRYTLNLEIYSSPYLAKQRPTLMHLDPGRSYSYAQMIQIGGTDWYYLGPGKWVRQINGYNSLVTKKSMTK